MSAPEVTTLQQIRNSFKEKQHPLELIPFFIDDGFDPTEIIEQYILFLNLQCEQVFHETCEKDQEAEALLKKVLFEMKLAFTAGLTVITHQNPHPHSLRHMLLMINKLTKAKNHFDQKSQDCLKLLIDHARNKKYTAEQTADWLVMPFMKTYKPHMFIHEMSEAATREFMIALTASLLGEDGQQPNNV